MGIDGRSRVIGLGGGMGSGKTTVSRFLAQQGWFIVDLDTLARDLTRKGKIIWKIFVLQFGRICLSQNGEINRCTVGRLVFRNRHLLFTINRIIHPVLRLRVRQILLRHPSLRHVVLDGAVLFEAGLLPLLDTLVYVEACPKIRLARLMEKGYPEREAMRRIESQIYLPVLKKRARVVVFNNGNMVNLKGTVQQLGALLNSPEQDGLSSNS